VETLVINLRGQLHLEFWTSLYMHNNVFHLWHTSTFYRATLCWCSSICCHHVSVCGCVCHPPVLYQMAKCRIMQI